MKKIRKFFNTLGVLGVIFGKCCTFHSVDAVKADKEKLSIKKDYHYKR